MIRLLPGMGPPTETPKTSTGKNKIRIKPSTTLPPANVNAKTIGKRILIPDILLVIRSAVFWIVLVIVSVACSFSS